MKNFWLFSTFDFQKMDVFQCLFWTLFKKTSLMFDWIKIEIPLDCIPHFEHALQFSSNPIVHLQAKQIKTPVIMWNSNKNQDWRWKQCFAELASECSDWQRAVLPGCTFECSMPWCGYCAHHCLLPPKFLSVDVHHFFHFHCHRCCCDAMESLERQDCCCSTRTQDPGIGQYARKRRECPQDSSYCQSCTHWCCSMLVHASRQSLKLNGN